MKTKTKNLSVRNLVIVGLWLGLITTAYFLGNTIDVQEVRTHGTAILEQRQSLEETVIHEDLFDSFVVCEDTGVFEMDATPEGNVTFSTETHRPIGSTGGGEFAPGQFNYCEASLQEVNDMIMLNDFSATGMRGAGSNFGCQGAYALAEYTRNYKNVGCQNPGMSPMQIDAEVANMISHSESIRQSKKQGKVTDRMRAVMQRNAPPQPKAQAQQQVVEVEKVEEDVKTAEPVKVSVPVRDSSEFENRMREREQQIKAMEQRIAEKEKQQQKNVEVFEEDESMVYSTFGIFVENEEEDIVIVVPAQPQPEKKEVDKGKKPSKWSSYFRG